MSTTILAVQATERLISNTKLLQWYKSINGDFAEFTAYASGKLAPHGPHCVTQLIISSAHVYTLRVYTSHTYVHTST